MSILNDIPTIGVGINYKKELFEKLNSSKVILDFYELTTEYFFKSNYDKDIQAILENYPVILHGLDLSIGTVSKLDTHYLSQLSQAVTRTSPLWLSDHFAYTQVDDIATQQLMPLQFSIKNSQFIANKVKEICKITKKPVLLENITYYFKFPKNELAEVHFYNSILEKTDCGMLLDLNNLYANSNNHNYDCFEFLDQLNLEKVIEIHLAGGDFDSDILIDTHAHNISNEVWKLLEYVLSRTKIKAIVLERDRNFEDINGIINDIQQAIEFKKIYM